MLKTTEMKKIIIPLLAAMTVGAQAQQFEQYVPTNPNWNPQCTHASAEIYNLDKKYSHMANFEFCPGWEGIQKKMICVLPDGVKENLRCYHSAYGKDEHIIGRPVVMCMVRSIRWSIKTLSLYCTEPKSAEEWLKEMGK